MLLYRPIGLGELRKIQETQMQAFPPRLAWQPIFYPVLNHDYALQIATQWNTKDEFSGYCGFVTQFEVNDWFLLRYDVHNVGGELHNELWIPAEDLAQMNGNIVGGIKVVEAVYGEKFVGERLVF
jgi:hypothetical protein